MSWDGMLSTAVVGAVMHCAKMMPAIVTFVLTASVGTLKHCAKMMPAEASLCACDSCYEKEMCQRCSCVCFSCACLHRCRGSVVDKPRGTGGL